MSTLTVAYGSGTVRHLQLPSDAAQSIATALNKGTVATLNANNCRIDLYPGQIEYVEVTPENGGES